MPRYSIRLEQSYIVYESAYTEVEADSPVQAIELAREAYNNGAEFVWDWYDCDNYCLMDAELDEVLEDERVDELVDEEPAEPIKKYIHTRLTK